MKGHFYPRSITVLPTYFSWCLLFGWRFVTYYYQSFKKLIVCWPDLGVSDDEEVSEGEEIADVEDSSDIKIPKEALEENKKRFPHFWRLKHAMK